MNKSYRSVWNDALGAWVAASEFCRARGKRSGGSRALAVAVLTVAGAFAGTASAQAVGGGTTTNAGTAISATPADCAGTSVVPSPPANAGGTGIAVGCAANATGPFTIGVGFGASAATPNGSGIAIGYQAIASSPAGDPIAIGTNAQAVAANAIALGGGAGAQAASSIAIGGPVGNVSGARVDANSLAAVVVGAGSVVEDSAGSTVVGAGSFASQAVGAVVVGSRSQAEAAGAIAIGLNARAVVGNSIAIGREAYATIENSVALGNGSATSKANPTASAVIGGVTYNYAGPNPGGVVAVGSNGDGQGNPELYRQLQQVAAGRVTATSTDGVNGSQLYAAHQAIDTLNDRSVKYDLLPDGTPDYGRVTLNPGQVSTTVTNVAAGAVTATSTDAVNGSQLFTTNNNVTNLGTTVTNLGTTVTNLGTTVTNLGNTVSTIDQQGTKYFRANSQQAAAQANGAESVAIGPNAVSTTANSVALGAGSVASTTTFAAAYTPTVGVAVAGATPAGEVSVGTAGSERRVTNVAAGAGDTDAVNVSQLKAVTASATANAVQYDDASKTTVTLGGGAGGTKITNVTPGTIAQGSTDAVNGGQLFTTNTNVTNLGTTVSTLTTTVTNIDEQGTKYFRANSQQPAAQAVGQDSVAIGPNAVANGTGNVAIGAGSVANTPNPNSVGYLVGTTATSEVNVGGRRVSDVAAGAEDDDAVNVRQLRRVRDESVHYDANTDGTINYGSVTLGGSTGATSVIHNVAPGVAGTDAVNVTQLTQVTNAAGNKWIVGNPATYVAPSATGAASTAVGSGATSTGANSVALGNDANDGGRANVVAVGAAGAQRQVTQVAAGTQSTDAVNVSQLVPFAQALGGGTKFNADGSITGPTYNITTVGAQGGTSTQTYDNVGDALGGLSSSVVNLNQTVNGIASGRGIKYFHANSQAADSSATGAESTAMGPQSNAAGEGATAAGDRSSAAGAGSVAVGRQSLASGDASVAVGQGAQATNAGSVAIGLDSRSSGINTVAIGTGAIATNSVAVGAGAQAGSGGAAFGDNAMAIDASKGTALGNAASVTSAGGVALGAGAVAERSGMNGQREALSGVAVGSTQGAVSVGSAGNERQITNVAGGTQATDAVNLRQLQATQAGNVRYDTNADGSTNYGNVTLGNGQAPNGSTVSNVAPGVAGTDAVNVNQLGAGLASANQYTDRRVGELQDSIDKQGKNANAGTAGAMAMANLPQAALPGKSMVAAGVAGYDGQAALAIGVSKLSDNGRWIVKFSGSANSRGKVGVAAGVGFHW